MPPPIIPARIRSGISRNAGTPTVYIPFGVILAALLFGMLEYGGLVINTMVPKELVSILQAIVIIFVISSNKIFRKILVNFIKKRTLRVND